MANDHSRQGRLRRLRRAFLVALGLAGAAALVVWQLPDVSEIVDSLVGIDWWWFAAAAGAGGVAVAVRAVAWDVVLGVALSDPRPARRAVAAAYGVGLLANAVIPARGGEVVRVGVLLRHDPRGARRWSATLATLLAHRLLDVVPATVLALVLVVTAPVPRWAVAVLLVVVGVGISFVAVAVLLARRPDEGTHERGRVRLAVRRFREGLAVMRTPGPALAAGAVETVSWALELLALWLLLRAFGETSLGGAALVLAMTNLVMAFPLWPGNVGLFQAATAAALAPYGVGWDTGIAYGIALQALEFGLAVGLGAPFLVREGISFAQLGSVEQSLACGSSRAERGAGKASPQE